MTTEQMTVTGTAMAALEGHDRRSDWLHWMHEYNEGLGLVYERLILNDYLDSLVNRFAVSTVLEAPIYGMAGMSGINSVRFAQRGCSVTLVDWNARRLDEIRRVWRELGLLDQLELVHVPDPSRLPFADDTFDLVWNWAALWYLPAPAELLQEMARTSGHLVFTAMPNRLQPGYILRKFVLDTEFFTHVDERWAGVGRARAILEASGFSLTEQGVLDVPPWPDTVMPAAEVLRRLGIQSEALESRFSGDDWDWSTMDYYLGRRPDLKAKMDEYAVLERAPIPWQLKVIWAHHRYILMTQTNVH